MGSIVIKDLQCNLSNFEQGQVYIDFLLPGRRTALIAKKIPKIKTWNPLTAIKWKISGRPIPEGCVKIKAGGKSFLVGIQELATLTGLTPEILLNPKGRQTAAEAIKQSVSNMSYVWKQLEELNYEGLAVATPTGPKKLTQNDMELIKDVVQTAFIIHTMHPQQERKAVETKLFVTKNIQLIARSEGASLTIIGLFGKVIGQGFHGTAIQTVNLLTGKLSNDDKAVVKVTQTTNRQNLANYTQEERDAYRELELDDIRQEAYISNLLHQEGDVIGLGKPLTLHESNLLQSEKRQETTEVKTETDAIHLGPLYAQGDLYHLIDTKNLSNLEARLWIAYQIAHGVSYMHRKHVTHGDIKPSNIFLGNQLKVALSDFAGSFHHDDPKAYDRRIAFTRAACCQSEINMLHHLSGMEREKGKELCEKMDVFATCITLFQTLTNGDDPFFGTTPYSTRPFNWAASFKQRLDCAKSVISEPTIDLLTQGLSENPQQRPSMEALHIALRKDLKQNAPDFYKLLRKKSH